MNRLMFVLSLCAFCTAKNFTLKRSNARMTMITEKIKPRATIDYKILKVPHHLFIGRCYPHHPVLYQEKILLNNDGKSHVSANIKINIEKDVYITCVRVIDETIEGHNGYPTFQNGGVGYNFVEFGVMTEYGKGFEFYVQIYGYPSKEEYERLNSKIS